MNDLDLTAKEGLSAFLEWVGVNALMEFGFAIGALFCAWWLLRYLDYRTGRPFKETMSIIRKEPNAAAMYYSYRWLGVCIVISAFIIF